MVSDSRYQSDSKECRTLMMAAGSAACRRRERWKREGNEGRKNMGCTIRIVEIVDGRSEGGGGGR